MILDVDDFKFLAPLLIFLPLTLVFIYRRWGDTLAELIGDLSLTTKVEPVAVHVTPLNIPFSVELKKLSDVDYINITSPVDNWSLYAVRNVKIETTLSDVLKIDQTGGYFDSVEQLLKNEDMQYVEYERPGTHRVNLLPSNSELSAGERRTTYPLLLFVTNHVDSLVCLVHIGDKFIKESYIIAQFYRNAAGLFHRLTALYSSTDSVEDECSVCLTSTASCAILPCRHRCACENCITRLLHCPICRSTISSYFIMGEQENLDSATESEED